jgi:rhamnosyltransferase
MNQTDISVVLPTRNGMATLPAVFERLDDQRKRFALEIVAVDSGSSDGTRELLASRVDRLIDIAPGDFNHGTTRNLGIESSLGELVVLLVQDAIPSSDDWLRALIEPLVIDQSVAGSFARQVPHVGASTLTRFYLSRWVTAGTERRIAWLRDPADLDAMAPMARLHF